MGLDVIVPELLKGGRCGSTLVIDSYLVGRAADKNLPALKQLANRRRNRLAKALKDFGNRVQYSVFECLMGAKELGKMRERIAHLTDSEEDSVRIYCLCGECERKVDIIGTGARTEDPDVYVL